jgi:hypothetical protein
LKDVSDLELRSQNITRALHDEQDVTAAEAVASEYTHIATGLKEAIKPSFVDAKLPARARNVLWIE